MKSRNKRGGPVSRVLYRGRRRRPRFCGAPLLRGCRDTCTVRTIYLGPAVTGRLVQPTRRAGASLLDGPSTCCSALLLARFTVPPPLPATRWALTPPFHPHRRRTAQPRAAGSMFSCGTVCPQRRRAPQPGRYPAPCPYGARTFLRRSDPGGPSGGGAPARLSLSLRSAHERRYAPCQPGASPLAVRRRAPPRAVSRPWTHQAASAASRPRRSPRPRRPPRCPQVRRRTSDPRRRTRHWRHRRHLRRTPRLLRRTRCDCSSGRT